MKEKNIANRLESIKTYTIYIFIWPSADFQKTFNTNYNLILTVTFSHVYLIFYRIINYTVV